MYGALIDEHGEIWAAEDAVQLHAGDELAKAIWTRGCIYLRSIGSRLLVAFRPSLVCRDTFIGAAFEICRRAPRLIILTQSSGLRSSERFDDVGSAIGRVEELIFEAQQKHPRGLRAFRMELDAVERIDGGVMTGLLEAWYQADRRWSAEFYSRLKDAALLDDAVVVRKPARTDTLLIEHWGKKRDLFGAAWVRAARGRQVEDQPYKGLAGWVARLYRDAIAANESRLDVVSVAIETETGERRERTYSRLLLPWHGEDGEAVALTVNVPELPVAAKDRRSRYH